MAFRALRPLLIGLFIFATADLSAFYIHLHGIVTEHFTGDLMKGVQVRMVKDSIERETIVTESNGKYEIYLERGYDYQIWFHRKDLVTKHVRIDAREIPLFPDVPFYDMDLQIAMFEWINGFDFSVFDMPVARAEYKHSVRNLNWNVEYTDGIRPEVAKVMLRYEREIVERNKLAARAGTTATVRKKKRKTVQF